MKKLLVFAVATAAAIGVSAVPSNASTCAGTCATTYAGLHSTNLGPDPSAVGFSDGNIAKGATISDKWTFTLSPPPPAAYGGFGDEITLGIGKADFINNLVVSIYNAANKLLYSASDSPATQPNCSGAHPPSSCSSSQTVTLAIASLSAGSYYLEVSGKADEKLSYSGTLGLSPVPLPATFALFAGGLGLLGFAGSQRNRKTGIVAS